ncbi:hypothetical protein EI94DRAFT_1705947 [Lactarius quietus]|nr:hypothetical protein EI94DRAFT_1705947 [Lactarius quietus]
MSSSQTFAGGIPDLLLNKLYSTPTFTGGPGLYGQTHESTQAVLEVLRHDLTHAPFINHLRFHNHSTHHVLAIYALGASPELIRDVYYKVHLPKLKPSFTSPGPIVEENFTEHLGDEKYYDAYLAFFTDYLQSHSPAEALEHFVFSPAYNFRSHLAATDGHGSKEREQPQMLSRVLGGLLHPFIHIAYGLEFGILGQIAQGLAQAAVHEANQIEVIPPSHFVSPAIDTELSNLMHRLEIADSGTSAPAPEKRPTFSFHRRIRDDPAFAVELPSSLFLHYTAVMKSAGSAIHDLVREWSEEWLAGVGTRADAEARLKGMVEEVVWGNVIWYGIGGWATRGTEGRGFNADFFMWVHPSLRCSTDQWLTIYLSSIRAHLVTSALFLPKIVLNEGDSPSASDSPRTPGLSFASRLLLLKTYFAVSTAWYVMRGGNRPLPITEFYAATDAQLYAPARAAGAGPGWTHAPRNPWPRVIQSSLWFQDEHMPKIARALADFAVRWGTRAPGYFAAAGKEKEPAEAPALALEGIERLDGTLIVRTAGLTFDRLGWLDEGEKARPWDQDGMVMSDV